MTRFERVVRILDAAIGGPDVNIAVHGAFWRGVTRDQFVAKKVQGRALERGLLMLTCGIHFNVIRFLMPLTIPDGVFAEALEILEQSIKA